ncbi:NAD-dependent protein deacylase [Porticoccaceae bacterium LTM1]|nr:NAD-dependent protein deacylase [Porticoccaceae bacterium LTM1]
MLKRYQSIVVLTGAGISAESGIRTFRAADGLWENHRIEDVATPEGFDCNPALVHDFYNQRRQQLLSESVQPNAAHNALAEFEQLWGGEFLLVTQNIDDLHERAGSRNLIHMHGELLKLRCQHSGEIHSWDSNASIEDHCPCCRLPGNLRPHVVWFGEMPLEMEGIYAALANCDLFVAIGTSGNVYPAAGFVQMAREARAHTVEINLEASNTASWFAEKIQGTATEQVPLFFQKILTTS